MSNAIRFLETLGQNPALSRIPSDQLQAMIESLELDPAQREAILQGDLSTLSRLVGGRAEMVGLIWEPGPEIPPGEAPDADTPDENEPVQAPEEE